MNTTHNITTTANTALTGTMLAEATTLILCDSDTTGGYSIRVDRTDTGWTVTDTTGGDTDTTSLSETIWTITDFIQNVADDDAAWMDLATYLGDLELPNVSSYYTEWNGDGLTIFSLTTNPTGGVVDRQTVHEYTEVTIDDNDAADELVDLAGFTRVGDWDGREVSTAVVTRD